MMNQCNVGCKSCCVRWFSQYHRTFTHSDLVCSCFLCSWVHNFGHEGLGLLLEALEKLLDKKQ